MMRLTLISLLVCAACGTEDGLPVEAIDASVPPPGGFHGPVDPTQCGNGQLDPGEACDDGAHGACGECNQDCSGPGTGSVCGDGFLCLESEVCDDGGITDCGPCNADCTGDGTGSTCGDGTVCPDTEACDDGATDECGPCNADCSAAGTGPAVCGDGDDCDTASAGDEACDDGYQDACGTCNADCTGPGVDAVCGDGDLCPETEICDDAIAGRCADPCACSETMFLPETGCGGVTSDGLFDAGEVYIFGGVTVPDDPADTSREALAHWMTPEHLVVAVDSFDAGMAIRNDSVLLFARSTINDGGIFEFGCDGCPWSGRDYPDDFRGNDNPLPHNPCNIPANELVSNMRLSPDGLVLHTCSWDPEDWYDETGTSRFYGQIVRLGFGGAVLSVDLGGAFVVGVDGGLYNPVWGDADGVLPRAARALQAIPPGSGFGDFWMVGGSCTCADGTCAADCLCDSACSCACDIDGTCTDGCDCDKECQPLTYELFRIDVLTGDSIRVVNYGLRPSHDDGVLALDANGNLFTVVMMPTGNRAVVMFPVDGSGAVTVYEGEGRLELRIDTRLITGP